ncbi:MFS transporter [Streptomyces sp. NBC_01476]|uniref:MFS transporter n=1 Tax=Streptomyces sp. NBC_01476 TaxID=2903881 RepID=UPI002E34AF18|nr:MFS transporter [Streptomyces sp. NBC_01476]
MAAAAGRLRTAFVSGPLAVRGFRLLLTGQIASTLGDYCYAVALPWLILSGHGGTVLLGTVLACYGIPRVVTIPLGGMVADRFGGRRVMLVADAVRAVAVGALAVLASTGTPTLAQLAPIAVVLGAGAGMFIPSSYTVLPALLAKDDLGRGNALSTMVNQFGGLLGPAAGGALVASFGAWPALAVDAASFAVSAAALFRMRSRPDPDGAVDAGPAEGAGTGSPGPSFAQLLRKGRLLHVVLVVALICNLAYSGTIEVALPDFAHERLGAAGYGVLLTCLSLGGLGGSLLAARSRTVQSPARLFAALAVVMGIALAVTPYVGGLVGAAVSLCLYAAASGWQNIVAVTMLQVWSPPALIGRVMSLVMLAVMGTFPISVAVAGFGVHHLGAAPFFPVAGAAIAFAVLAALTQKAFRGYHAGGEYAPPPTSPSPDADPPPPAADAPATPPPAPVPPPAPAADPPHTAAPAGPAAPDVPPEAPAAPAAAGTPPVPVAADAAAKRLSGGSPRAGGEAAEAGPGVRSARSGPAPGTQALRSTHPWHDSSQESQA